MMALTHITTMKCVLSWIKCFLISGGHPGHKTSPHQTSLCGEWWRTSCTKTKWKICRNWGKTS
jgi:SET domain-containing protein